MSESTPETKPGLNRWSGPLTPDWPTIDFPSDHLSVKRFRTIFPKFFDEGGALSDGVSTFFKPSNDRHPSHLEQLNDLINYERTVVEYGFYTALNSIDDRSDAACKEAKEKLEPLYLEFKLANSPENARLLIQHLHEQGTQQAQQFQRGVSRV